MERPSTSPGGAQSDGNPLIASLNTKTALTGLVSAPAQPHEKE